MKIICTQENLKTGLSTVGRIVSSSNTLPILSNLLIKTENGLLKISSTNLEIAITTQIRCKVEEEGQVTVVSKTFNDLVNNLPNSNITLQSEGSTLKVEAENYHTAIKTLPAEEFPLIPELEDGQSKTLDAQLLKKSLDQVVFAASTNQTQPEISGILFAYSGNELRVAATDRYRLAEKKVTMPQNVSVEQELIIPQKTLQELGRIIGNQKGDVLMGFNNTQVAFNFNDTKIISRLVDGQYPPYREIIPTQFITNVVLEKQALSSALKASSVFTQNNNSVKFLFSKQNQMVIVETESSELGNSRVETPASIEGEDKEIILNYHYILDCLNSIESEKVLIKIIDDNSPSLILPQTGDDYIYLVMPIKG